MRKGVLFQRVFLVAMATLVLTTGFTALLYTAISRWMFNEIKRGELTPKAYALGDLVFGAQGDGQERAALLEAALGDSDAALLGGYAVIVDEHGEVLMRSSAFNSDQAAQLRSSLSGALAGRQVVVSGAVDGSQVRMFGVGVPIERDGSIRGAVMLFVPLYEAMAAVSGLSSALLMSLLTVVPIVTVIVYGVAGRIAHPLRQMRDVAIAMAGGDFSARADDEQRGEIGELGASLNHLSRELSNTISLLTLERNRLMQSVDGLSEGFVSVNALGAVTHYNPAFSALTSSLPRLAGDRRLALAPLPDLWRCLDAAIAEGQPVGCDIALPGRTLRAQITPLTDEKGQSAGAVGLLRDVTESERLEATRRDYVANVSHELRTPLTALRGLIEPLRDGLVTSDEARSRYYDIILRETMRLSRLIDDLMALSRIQSGQMPIPISTISLRELAEDLGEKYRAAAEDKSLSFRLTFDPSACPPVESNADRVEQILVILLDNAIKYTPPGGAIELGARWDGDRVTMSVRDTGPGIAPADQPHVFERFYKVDKSHSGLGSGLGLSIARELLRLMGEEIGLVSEPGAGSEFYFTLRRANAE
ncbi:MAG: HAMP domain-containing protein [Clostridiales bacterium]|nr:HAMP domain-containing protein [Clostridiales bacterium]